MIGGLVSFEIRTGLSRIFVCVSLRRDSKDGKLKSSNVKLLLQLKATRSPRFSGGRTREANLRHAARDLHVNAIDLFHSLMWHQMAHAAFSHHHTDRTAFSAVSFTAISCSHVQRASGSVRKGRSGLIFCISVGFDTPSLPFVLGTQISYMHIVANSMNKSDPFCRSWLTK